MGDPAGIGSEITTKAWLQLKSNPEQAFAVIAPPALFADIPTISITTPDDIHQCFARALPILPISGADVLVGQPCVSHAPAITQSIEQAVTLALGKKVDGIVTNPIAKDVLYEAGFPHPGHTEYLGQLTQNHKVPYTTGPVMMLTAQDLRVALATVHLPLSEVPAHLTQDIIIRKTKVLHGALQTDFGIAKPRIAMTGLNPHAGEGGALGQEEIQIINPAARLLRDMGINITDAQPADTLFHTEARQGYDGVLAMYHDQGLIPVKTLDFHGGVNTTLGLPIIRTSPDHGTAFNIAGQGVARPDSLIAAIKLARQQANMRYGYDV